jgi:hypothetical protein
MRESILVLLPIFLGFVVLHLVLIVYGVAAHGDNLSAVVPGAIGDARSMSHALGPLVVIALLMRAFSLGGGTYTGLEAMSNNVNMLAEPRVPNGKITMFYMSSSLAFTAGGIILLYMLWHAQPVEGQTLNALVFGRVIDHLGLGSALARHGLLPTVLAFEAALLLVGAAPFSRPVDAARQAERHRCDGRRKPFDPAVDTRRRFDSCGPVQHQRVSDVQPVTAWHVHVLVASPP